MIEIRSLRDVLRLFFIFRREFQYAVIVTVLMAVLGAFLLPAKYESNARLLVKPGIDNTTLPIEASNRQTLIAPSTQRDPIVDEEKMLTGRPIVRLVAERYLQDVLNYQPKGFWKTTKFYIGKAVSSVIDGIRSLLQVLGLVEKQTDVDRLAKQLEKNFSAVHETGSAVIEISFTWDNPLIAQKVVEFWVKAFLEERTHALGRKSLYEFYEGESQKVAKQINALKVHQQQRLQTIDSISVTERLNNLTNQLNRMTDARLGVTNELAGIRNFLADAQQQLKRQPAEVVTTREISLNPTQLDLKRQLNGLSLERTRLLRTYREEAAPVRQVDASIQAVEALVAKEVERLQRSENRAPNSIIVSLKQQMVDAQLREQQLRGQASDYDRQLRRLRAERQQALASEPELNQLALELAAANKSYSLYTENLEKARIDRELENSQISNIALIEQATYNPSRVFPKSLMMLFLALPAGLAVGLLSLYLCYLLDNRIHDGATIEEAFGVPLWSSIQDLGNPPHHANSAFTASLYRIYGLLPLEQVAERGLTLAFTSARPGEGVSFILNHLQNLLEERGHHVRADGQFSSAPGQITLLDASALLSNQEAFIVLRHADLIVLVIEAQYSTVPMVQSALSTLTTAFKKVDGIVLNRRRFEIPERALRILNRWRSAV